MFCIRISRFRRINRVVQRLDKPQIVTVAKSGVNPMFSSSGARRSTTREEKAKVSVVSTPTYKGSFLRGLTSPKRSDVVEL